MNRREFLKKCAAVAAGCTLANSALASAPVIISNRALDITLGRKYPNIVLILTDDLGYDDIGCYWTEYAPDPSNPYYSRINTPNIDSIAAQGVKFTEFYASETVCTPTRASLLTGCYAPRVGLGAVINQNSNSGLNPNEITIAELLKAKGYATGMVGKWHLGDYEDYAIFSPNNHGFDYYYGIPYSNDMGNVPLMEDGNLIKYLATDPDRYNLTRDYNTKALQFIENNKDRPFFLYFAHTMPHTPLWVADQFKTPAHPRGLYGDSVEEIDDSVGQVLNKLKQLALEENTLVIFTSDNGPWLRWRDYPGEPNKDRPYDPEKIGGKAYPLRHGKATTYEGGMRVPTLMCWPGKIPPASTCSELATTMDLYPTLARLAKTEVPQDRIVDAKDIWPLIAQTPGATSPHQELYYWYNDTIYAIRQGKWKFRLQRTLLAWMIGQAITLPEALYDLDNDPGELTDVSAGNQAKVTELRGLISSFQANLLANRRSAGTG